MKPYLRNLCLIEENKDFSPMFSIRCFVVLGFAFRSLVHFEVIFVQASFFAYGCPIFPVPFVESISYLRQ